MSPTRAGEALRGRSVDDRARQRVQEIEEERCHFGRHVGSVIGFDGDELLLADVREQVEYAGDVAYASDDTIGDDERALERANLKSPASRADVAKRQQSGRAIGDELLRERIDLTRQNQDQRTTPSFPSSSS